MSSSPALSSFDPPSILPIEPNTVLGPVQLKRVLRRDATSALYEGEYLRFGTLVMVNLMWDFPIEDRTRFLREALVAYQLRGRGLVRTIDFGDHQDLRYMVTDRVPGTTLEEYLDAKPEPLPESVIWALLTRIAGVLRTCHIAGLAHRDLTPASIRIDRSGRLRVTGFGMAPAVRTGLKLSERPSPYLPPESARQEGPLGARADVFAVGVLAYQLAYQRLPYPRGAAGQRPGPYVAEAPSFDLPTHCSARLLDVIADLIHPDPRARIDTARELLHALAGPISPPTSTSPPELGPGTTPPEQTETLPASRLARRRWRRARRRQRESGVGGVEPPRSGRSWRRWAVLTGAVVGGLAWGLHLLGPAL